MPVKQPGHTTTESVVIVIQSTGALYPVPLAAPYWALATALGGLAKRPEEEEAVAAQAKAKNLAGAHQETAVIRRATPRVQPNRNFAFTRPGQAVHHSALVPPVLQWREAPASWNSD